MILAPVGPPAITLAAVSDPNYIIQLDAIVPSQADRIDRGDVRKVSFRYLAADDPLPSHC
jgi:hypothetical protein